ELRHHFGRQLCPGDFGGSVELQLQFALREGRPLLYEREQRRQRRLPAAVPAVDDVVLTKGVEVARPREIAKHTVAQLGDARELHATSSTARSAASTGSSPESRRGSSSSRMRASECVSRSLFQTSRCSAASWTPIVAWDSGGESGKRIAR